MNVVIEELKQKITIAAKVRRYQGWVDKEVRNKK